MEQGRYRTGEQKAAAGKQDDKIAKAMNLLNQRKRQAEDEEEILRILSKPRSKKYIECVQKTMALSRRYQELEERRKALAGKSEKGPKKEASAEPAKKPEKEAEKGWWDAKKEALAEPAKEPAKEAEKGWWDAKKEAPAEPAKEPAKEAEKGWWEVGKEASAELAKEAEKEAEKGWWDAKETPAEAAKEAEKGWWDAKKEAPEKPAIDNSRIKEIEREMAQIEQEMEELDKELIKEMPWRSQFLGHIFPVFRQEELIRRGFDLGPPGGEPFSTMSEMFEQVQPPTEHEKNQWELAYKVLYQDRPKTLIVEIYWTAVCAVFEDGSTKVVTEA